MKVLDLSRKPFGINTTRKLRCSGATQQCVEPHIDDLPNIKIMDLRDNQLEDAKTTKLSSNLYRSIAPISMPTL